MNKIPTLTLLAGIPRVGKSSWINKNKGQAIIVSPDAIRKEIFGHQFYAPANKFVFAISEAMTTLLLKQGKDVIVDATHVTKELRLAWYPIIKTIKCKTRLIWIFADEDITENLKICLERNKNGPKEDFVPENVIERMAMIFDEPDPNDTLFEVIKYKNS